MPLTQRRKTKILDSIHRFALRLYLTVLITEPSAREAIVAGAGGAAPHPIDVGGDDTGYLIKELTTMAEKLLKKIRKPRNGGTIFEPVGTSAVDMYMDFLNLERDALEDFIESLKGFDKYLKLIKGTDSYRNTSNTIPESSIDPDNAAFIVLEMPVVESYKAWFIEDVRVPPRIDPQTGLNTVEKSTDTLDRNTHGFSSFGKPGFYLDYGNAESLFGYARQLQAAIESVRHGDVADKPLEYRIAASRFMSMLPTPNLLRTILDDAALNRRGTKTFLVLPYKLDLDPILKILQGLQTLLISFDGNADNLIMRDVNRQCMPKWNRNEACNPTILFAPEVAEQEAAFALNRAYVLNELVEGAYLSYINGGSTGFTIEKDELPLLIEVVGMAVGTEAIKVEATKGESAGDTTTAKSYATRAARLVEDARQKEAEKKKARLLADAVARADNAARAAAARAAQAAAAAESAGAAPGSTPIVTAT